MEVLCNFTSGSDVEGVELDADLVGVLWPGQTPAQVCDGLRGLMKIQLVYLLMLSGQTPADANNFVLQHTRDIH